MSEYNQVGKGPKILLSVVLLLLIFGLLRTYFILDPRIAKKHILLVGSILEIGRGGKHPSYVLVYSYTLHGKIFKNCWDCSIQTRNKYMDGISKILVVAENDNLSHSAILEKRNDFEKYNIKNTDTIGLGQYKDSVIMFWPCGYPLYDSTGTLIIYDTSFNCND